MPSYLEVEYPHGINKTYVRLLCSYLQKQYNLKAHDFLLDVGAGTGDYWQEFARLMLVTDYIPEEYDLEKEWPKDCCYDYVFCKSVLEHILDTKHFLSETKRVLKLGGLAIFLVPDWERQIKCFWDDSTHVKPFTRKGLIQAFKLADFKNIQCDYFYQLPFVWRHRWLKFVPHLINLMPDRLKWKGDKQRVLIRHSKERMLLLSARK